MKLESEEWKVEMLNRQWNIQFLDSGQRSELERKDLGVTSLSMAVEDKGVD